MLGSVLSRTKPALELWTVADDAREADRRTQRPRRCWWDGTRCTSAPPQLKETAVS